MKDDVRRANLKALLSFDKMDLKVFALGIVLIIALELYYVISTPGTTIYVFLVNVFLSYVVLFVVASFYRYQRINTEDALLASEERFRDLFENANDIIQSIAPDGSLIYVNRAWRETLGYNEDEVHGLSLLDVIHPDSVDHCMDIFQRVMKGEKINHVEAVFLSKEGRRVTVEGSINCRFKDGTPLATQGIFRDITEHKRYEEKLEALHRHSDELAKAETLEEIKESTLNALKQTLGYDYLGFGVVEGNFIRFTQISGKSSISALPLDGPGITVRAVNTGETQLLSDTRRDPDYLSGRIDGEPESLSELDVPISVDDKVIAVINIESNRLNAFTDRDRRLLEVFAEHVASAVARLRHIKNLQASEERWRTLLEESMDAVCVNVGTELVYVNRRFVELLDYDDPSELVGRDITEFFPPEQRDQIRVRTLRRQQGGEEPMRYETKFLRKDGPPIDIETMLSVIDFGGETAVLGFIRDITERKRYEERLKALHVSVKELGISKSLDDVYDAIVKTLDQVLGFEFGGIARIDGEIIRYITLFGVNQLDEWTIPLEGPSVTGRVFRTGTAQLIPDVRLDPDYTAAVTDGSAPLMLSELAVPVIVDGVIEMVINIESTRLNAFTQQDQELLETLAQHVASSVTIIRNKEALQIYLEELERSNRELDDYTYVVSHDLKSPLRSITAFSSFLLEDYEDKLDETGQEYLRRIESASTRMDNFINDLLVLSRIGRKYTDEELVDFNELMETIKLDFSAQLEEAGAEIIVGELPRIGTQKVWTRQLFANLVGNGLKFNRSPNPRVEVSCEERLDDYLFSVTDNGIGIREGDEKRLFRLFQRLHNQDEFEGTGAGLAICKKIVEAFRGKMWVESQHGSGSTFYFTYPKEKIDKAKTKVSLTQMDDSVEVQVELPAPTE